jgi:Indoleamine 2,3-dioxygenase
MVQRLYRRRSRRFDVSDAEEAIETVAQNEWLKRKKGSIWEAHEMMEGASAAQCSTIHAVDAFLGIQGLTHENGTVCIDEDSSSQTLQKRNFLARMRAYIPRTYRRFLELFGIYGENLRDHVICTQDGETVDAYNTAIDALCDFRTRHISIVA